MAIYTVLTPAVPDGEAADPMRPVLVKDGFSWPALLIALPWMLYRRMWLVLVLYVVAAIAVGFLLRRTGGDLGGFVVILLHFLFALEANNLRRWTLEGRGYRFAGVAEGRNLEEAEIRYFTAVATPETATLPAVPPTPPTPPAPSAPPAPPSPPRLGPMPPSAESGDVVGLFPTPAGGPRSGSS